MVTDYSNLKTELSIEFNQYVIAMAKSDSWTMLRENLLGIKNNSLQVAPHMNVNPSSFISDQKEIQLAAEHCSKLLREPLLSYKFQWRSQDMGYRDFQN